MLKVGVIICEALVSEIFVLLHTNGYLMRMCEEKEIFRLVWALNSLRVIIILKIIGTIVKIRRSNHCNPCPKRFNSATAVQALLQLSMHFIFSTGMSVSLGIFSI